MTRKDVAWLAAVLSKERDRGEEAADTLLRSEERAGASKEFYRGARVAWAAAADHVANAIADELARTYAFFNRARFLAAVGVADEHDFPSDDDFEDD